MNTRRLWNSHKFLSVEMAFPGVFQRYFHRGCYVVWSEYTQDWEQCRQNVPGVPGHHTVRTFHRSKPLNMHSMSNWEADALQFFSMALFFCQQLWQKEMKVAGGFGRLPALTQYSTTYFMSTRNTHAYNHFTENIGQIFKRNIVHCR